MRCECAGMRMCAFSSHRMRSHRMRSHRMRSHRMRMRAFASHALASYAIARMCAHNGRQWETSLQSYTVSHWLHANLVSALWHMRMRAWRMLNERAYDANASMCVWRARKTSMRRLTEYSRQARWDTVTMQLFNLWFTGGPLSFQNGDYHTCLLAQDLLLSWSLDPSCQTKATSSVLCCVAPVNACMTSMIMLAVHTTRLTIRSFFQLMVCQGSV